MRESSIQFRCVAGRVTPMDWWLPLNIDQNASNGERLRLSAPNTKRVTEALLASFVVPRLGAVFETS